MIFSIKCVRFWRIVLVHFLLKTLVDGRIAKEAVENCGEYTRGAIGSGNNSEETIGYHLLERRRSRFNTIFVILQHNSCDITIGSNYGTTYEIVE